MKRYTQAEEETIQAQRLIREWRQSGFLNGSDAAKLEGDLTVDLKRTNFFLRAVLFLFGVIIVVATAWLIIETFRWTDDFSTAVVCAGLAIVFFAVSEWLVVRRRLYRFGIEEALLTMSAVFLSIAAAQILGTHKGFVGLAAGSICGLSLFMMFGYVYGAIASLMCAALLPFTTSLSGEVQRLLAAMICGAGFMLVRPRRLFWKDDFPGGDYGLIQAAAWAGTYYAVNLKLSGSFFTNFTGPFYWVTYLLTWILPIVGLRLSLSTKDRPLMNLNLAMLLATLITNKPYLGMVRRPWDPILFGLLLTGSAVLIKRWLSQGPNGQRNGFTAVRLLAGDKHLLDTVATASAALQPHISPPDSPPPFQPGGGRSGGAGASGSF